MYPGSHVARVLLLALAAAALAALFARPAHGYLSVIRQGQESADLAQSDDDFGATLAIARPGTTFRPGQESKIPGAPGPEEP